MNKPTLKNQLRDSHKDFINSILSLTDKEFLISPEGKWTAGQQLDHIYRTVSAIKTGMSFPKFLLKIIVGKSNRPSRDYDALVNKYKSRLERGGRAGGRFIPKDIPLSGRAKRVSKLSFKVDRLINKIDRFSEEQMDEYILPHPLLGKLTIREMLYFTIHHTDHHRQMVLRNLGRKVAAQS
jgi:hypothetical protein